ncbi:MAG: hypothetical protein K8H85_00390 [Cyclobacteriaceae bacterium]|nr:hypothetical protein [Cyclobacteriaceae bacterium]
MKLSLFSTKSSESGFRLHSYEVWNWGTFDRQSYKIEPLGETSLLTGANASGKTTLIDGLLTLLVPERRMRFYNQTAGLKGERTEDSYVLGEYGENEEADGKETKKLRPDKSKAHSVLLAVFQNESQFVTLAQARWFSGAELKRTFILCHKHLTIANDFAQFDSSGDWKKRLKQKYPKQGSKDAIQFMDTPVEYGRLMRKVFGMRSEKAHTLFSQTIGVKVLGDLNDFVRLQMLEERDSETEFQKIKNYFKTLSDAHRAIEKAYQQIELLSPIRDKAIQLSKLNTDLLVNENHKSAAPLWFAQKRKSLIELFTEVKTNELQTFAEERGILENDISQLSDQERELDIQIKSDEVGKQISSLERKNGELTETKNDRSEELKRYNELAESLEFQSNPQTRESFDEQRSSAITRKKATESVWEQNDQERISASSRKQSLGKDFEAISNELIVLRSQKNNITGSVARIRSEIIAHLGVSEKDIPFIGELIQVRKSAKEWESAIERLLHNFALRLLIPVEYYQKVNKYVNENDLRGRIIYHKFDKKEVAPSIFNTTSENDLINKLELKDSPYKEWVVQEIEKSYNYSCVESVEEFRLLDKAILKSGLIKNKTRHEKDDRPEIRTPQQYVLGWDNKEKIAARKEQAELINKEIKQVDQKITYLKNHQTRISIEKENLIRLIDFNSFKKIDWWSISTQIQQNKQKIEELQKTSDRINTLKKQRNAILESIKSKSEKLEDLKTRLRDIESEISTQHQNLRKANEVLDSYAGLEVNEKLQHFENEFAKDIETDIASIDPLNARISREINERIERLKDQIRDDSSSVESLMRQFINPAKEIADKFEDWNTDTHRLREKAEFIDEYVALLEKIENQELAEFKQQFKKYLNEEMITKMSDFQTWLERQEEEIEENIETLNRSLSQINFRQHPPTFISLQAEKDYSPKVRDFKIKLQDWKPNLIEFERTKDDSILEDSFNKIKTLLDQLTIDDNTRKEVLDVRNWLKFKAVELYREDTSKQFRSYTGTAKLSGGEGAQLTYTILSSAIAYQFGIHSEGLNTNSFRFICVDEAFSKQDDEKAKFLMELCKQLHLQLMVVSPAKAEEVAIVEPFIARVHFVQRKDNRNSIVFDMPIKQLQEHRQQYLESAES